MCVFVLHPWSFLSRADRTHTFRSEYKLTNCIQKLRKMRYQSFMVLSNFSWFFEFSQNISSKVVDNTSLLRWFYTNVNCSSANLKNLLHNSFKTDGYFQEQLLKKNKKQTVSTILFKKVFCFKKLFVFSVPTSKDTKA